MPNTSNSILPLRHLRQHAGGKPHQGARDVGAALLVVALHLLGLWLWLASANHPHAIASPALRTAITVWLAQLPATRLEETQPPARQPAPSIRPGQAVQVPSASPAAEPAPATPLPDTPSAREPAQPATPRPLNLSLPRGVASTLAAPSLAAQTPFHGRLPATVERQIENVAAQSGPWTEERLDYDHIRFRRGDTCVVVERPAASRIDPSNDAFQRLPWLANVSKCP